MPAAEVEAEAQVEEAQVVAPVVVAPVVVARVEEAQGAVAQAVAAVKAVEASVDRRVHSEADWLRATRSRHRRNPPPGSASRVRTLRQRLLPVGCSPLSTLAHCGGSEFRPAMTDARWCRGRAPQ
jgi:hypothetical protein